MELIFAVTGIASLVYFILILLYNGLTSFLWFWPLLSLGNLLMLAAVRYLRRQRKRKQEVRIAPFVFLFSSYAIGVIILAVLLLLIFTGRQSGTEQNLDYVIVLGTDLDRNRISPSLRHRLDRAVEYAESNPNTVFVLSGGRGKYDASTQATVMYYYMIQHGVPPTRLLMEFYSDSTQEKVGYSVQTILADRAEEQYGSRGMYGELMFGEKTEEAFEARLPEGTEVIFAEDRPLSVGILTSDFNLFRAVSMARRYGLSRVYPIGTGTDELMLVHFSVKEAVEIFKDRLIGNI